MFLFPKRGLEMSKYVNDPNSKQRPHVYDLYGVINHIGNSLYSGHYTSFARTHSSDDSTKDELGWRLFDDSHVSKIRHEEAVQTRDASVLFDRWRTDDAVGQGSDQEVNTFMSQTPSTTTSDDRGSKESDEEAFTSHLYHGSSDSKLFNRVKTEGSKGDDLRMEDIEELTNDSDMECSGD